MLESGITGGRYYRLPWWSEDVLSDINHIASDIMENDWHLQRCLSGDAGEADLNVVREVLRVPGKLVQPLRDVEVGYNARVGPDGVHNRFCQWRFDEVPERPGMRELASQVRDLFPMTHDTVDLDEAYRNCIISESEGYLLPHKDIAVPAVKLLIPLTLDMEPLEFYNDDQELLGTMIYQGPTLINVGEFHGVQSTQAKRHFFQYYGFNDEFQTICEALEALNEN